MSPCDGETLSGDAAFVHPVQNGVLAAVIDALGHGPDAHRLSVQLTEALLKWLAEESSPKPEKALEVLDESARETRGAVATVAWLNGNTFQGSAAGIGNVRCRLFGTVKRDVEFGDGVLGQRMRTPRSNSFTLQPADTVMLFSDGVISRFSADDYPTLGLDSAPAVAFNIVRRFRRGTDDASCVVLRCRG